MFYWIAFYFFRLMQFLYFPTTVLGKENVPSRGGFIFASNHLSNLDPVLLGLAIGRRTSYMAKDTLFKHPVINVVLRAVEAFPINREGADIRAMRESLRRLKAGSPLVVFPTGTRMAVDAKAGVGFLVAKAQVPVVPVKVIDTHKALAPGTYWFKRHPVQVIVGKPLVLADTRDYEQTAKEVISAIDHL